MISFLAVSSGAEEFRASLPVVSLICICRTSGSVPSVFHTSFGLTSLFLVQFSAPIAIALLWCSGLETQHDSPRGWGGELSGTINILICHYAPIYSHVSPNDISRQSVSWTRSFMMVLLRHCNLTKDNSKYYVLHMHADIKQQPRTDWCERLYRGNWTGQGNVHMCTNVSSLFLIKRLETQSTQKTRKQNRKTCFIVNFVVVGYIRQVLYFVTMAIARIKFRNPVGRSILIIETPSHAQ